MTKITDTQLIVLSKAAAREGGYAERPARLGRAAAMKVGASLVARGLMRELRARPGMPVWREDADGRGISLMITKAGRQAVNADDDDSAPASGADRASSLKAEKAARGAKGGRAPASTLSPNVVAPRAGTKQARIIDLLSSKTGASLDALIEATGWLPHTTRAALTSLRKKGFRIERDRHDGVTAYRIVGTPTAGAA